MLKYNLHKAQKEGYRVRRPSGRTFLESVWHWTVQFDCEYRNGISRSMIELLLYAAI